MTSSLAGPPHGRRCTHHGWTSTSSLAGPPHGRRCTHHGWTSRWQLNVGEEDTRMHIVALVRTQCETSALSEHKKVHHHGVVTPAHTAPRNVNHSQV